MNSIKNIDVFILARLGSERLPKKINNGQILVNRLKKSET
jgi:hypothetical protein